jgi:putative ABC transport system permease protein
MQNLKTYLRILFKNKVLSCINILGLALGISSCLFIVLYVTDELNYDSYHANINRIYRISTEFVSEGSVDHVAISSSPLNSELVTSLPGVEHIVRFNEMGDEKTLTVKIDDKLYRESHVYKTDPEVFKTFSYKLLQGNPDKALAVPGQIVLTQSVAKKYFGQSDPIGKHLTISKVDYEISGVMEDVPANSDLKFPMLVSMDTSDRKDDWFDFSYYAFVLFNEKSIQSPDFVKDFEKKLNIVADDKINRPLRENRQNTEATLFLTPLRGLHFRDALLYDTPKGDLNDVYMFSGIALLILLIGGLNYVNFSIVQSIERSREVGIRKVVGASFWSLVTRYMSESCFTVFLALVVASIGMIFLLPLFNSITSKAFEFSDLLRPDVLGASFVIIIIIGVLAGSYPALYASSFKTVSALKGKITTPKGKLIRKVSVTAQFFISIGLIICTAIVFDQMTYIKNFDLGFRKNNVIVLSVPTDSLLFSKNELLQEQLLKNTAVGSVALTGFGALPGSDQQRGSITIRNHGKDEVRMIDYTHVDEDYLPTMDIPLASGRNFADGSISDRKNAVLVNEAFARMMGWENALGEEIVWQGVDRTIIGVVRDFHYLSLHHKVEPQIFVYHDKTIANVVITLNGNDPEGDIAMARDYWNKIFTDEPFVYRFLDENVNAQYEKESMSMKLFSYFSILTVLISCLGLFGLSSLTIFQRKKEIGIRKVVGASFQSITMLFTKEYLFLIALAMIIVSPLVWFMMDKWLESFIYRTGLSVYLFITIGILILTVSFVTIVLSIIRIATTRTTELIGDR